MLKQETSMNRKIFTLVSLAVLGLAITAFTIEGIGKESAPKVEKATFAGGCFWCMQPPFDRAPGVISTVVGYTGGTQKNPTYEEVSSGRTGHAEAIEITFDPKKVSYDQLLDIFWRNIDPTTPNRQFADVGTQYRTAIFYHNEEQKKLAVESKRKLNQSGKFDSPIATEIVPASTFYPAEEYHQKYYLKNTAHYKAYRKGSGREGYLKKTWGDSADH
jgi:methionine-S-sulfoxide reductase